MRSIGIAGTALATALIALTAGTASAQQNPITLKVGSGGFIFGNAGAGTAEVSDGSTVSVGSLQGIALTGKQREAIAKLDSAHAAAVAAAEAQHIAAIRAVLTDAQRVKFDANETARKEQLGLARKSLSGAINGQATTQSSPGNVMVQIQMDNTPTTPVTPPSK